MVSGKLSKFYCVSQNGKCRILWCSVSVVCERLWLVLLSVMSILGVVLF